MPKIIRITTVPISLDLLLTDQMKYMKARGLDVTMISAAGERVDRLVKEQGCPHIEVNLTRQITPLADLKALYHLIQIFKEYQPDIVHTHTPKAGLLGMIAAKICQIPLRLHTIAGLPLMTASGLKKKILLITEKLTYWGAHKVLPNSKSLRAYMLKNKMIKESKLAMIGKGSTNGIDLERFSSLSLDTQIINRVRASIDFQPDDFIIMAIGRVVKDKGIIELIQVFSKISQTYPKVKLVLLGPMENQRVEENIPTEILDTINNHQRIVHINWSDQVEHYLSVANLLIHASHREGFPNVLLQAGAMKCPIICSNIPGNIDIIEDQKTGLLFEVKNETQLLKAMNYAIENKDKMIQMSETLSAIIHQNFDRQNIHEEIFQYYTKGFQN